MSANHNIITLLIDLTNVPQSNTLVFSLLAGAEKNDTIQFLSLLVMSSNKYPRIPSLIIAELLKNNQTLNVVKLIEGILPSLQANYSLITLDISDDTLPDETYPANKHFSPGLENVERNVTNLKSLSLHEPLIPFSVLFAFSLFYNIRIQY